MDMFGGLTKTSSRIALAATFGLILGGFAFKATPAQAADLGGDCCADLEERVAELEATTVRKGNKKVSVTLSGWVVKSMNYWDDGDIDHFVVGDKDYDLGTRFAITGSATIAPGWTGGFNITVNSWGDCFGTVANQLDDLGACVSTDDTLEILTTGGNNYSAIGTLYSYIYIKSDKWGALNWGHLSPASDNPAVLADVSGTVIESNAVWFEGPNFRLRPNGQGGTVGAGLPGLVGLTWGDFLRCQGLGANIGADCWGLAQPAVRYDSPTWGGFRFEASYGKNQLTGPVLTALQPFAVNNFRTDFVDTSDTDFADIAVFYTGDWNSIKLSAAASYTWIEKAVRPLIAGSILAPLNATGTNTEGDLFQIGGSILHKPSGFGIYGYYQHEETGGNNRVFTDLIEFDEFVSISNPDTDVWYVKPFWRKAWSPIGATVLFAEYGEYQDQFGAAEIDFCAVGFGPGTNVGNFCGAPGLQQAFVTGSEVQRWGLGVVQEIDSAAMHLWLRWQHQEIDDLQLLGLDFPILAVQDGGADTRRLKQGFDEWDLIQVGGIIFF
jgi:hypothetical protein